MKKFSRMLRLVALAVIIAFASMGLIGMPLFGNRERYMDKENTIELVEKKEGESEEQVK